MNSAKKIILAILGSAAMVGCVAATDSDPVAGEETLGETDEAVINGWIGPVSEESGVNPPLCADWGMGATQAWCSGRYCDDMYLFCGSLPSGFTYTGEDRGWTPPVSEEGGNPGRFCPANSVIDGIRATGSYADNISLHCRGTTFPANNGYVCAWTPWFSEEQGGQDFFVSQYYSDAVARGVRCSGSYCDAMSYYVCVPKCTSNADCFGVCSNGFCTIG